MKRTFLVLCAAFALGSVGFVGAQSDTYGGGQSTSSKKYGSHSEKSREVTLTGCLEQGSTPDTFVLRNATESSASSSMSNSGGSSSQMSGSSSTSGGSQGTTGSSGSEQTGTSGQSGTEMSGQSSQSSQSGMDFQLVGKAKDLKRYVGQRVEVRGKVEPMKEGESGQPSSQGSTSGTTGSTSGTEGTTGSTSGSSQSGQSGSMSGGSMSGQSTSAGAVTHRVKVNSVKQLSSSCQ